MPNKNLPNKNLKNTKSYRKGIVQQRNYVLNKKKMRAEGKKHEMSIGKEASNITIPMEASSSRL